MNYLDLINIKYSFKIGLFTLVIVFLILMIYLLNLDMYESFSTYGYAEEGKIVTKINIDTPEILNNVKYIKIGDKNYNLESFEVVDVILDDENFINYNLVKLKISNRLTNNEAFKFDIFYNEEKVYKKLKKILL